MVDLDSVPASLVERLGLEATGGLVQLFNRAQKEWSAEVLSVAAERFDRRLVEETSKLRVEVAQGFATLREEIAEQKSELRQEMAQGFATLRQEIAGQNGELRQDMAQGLASVRQDMVQGLASVRQDMAQGLASVRQDTVQSLASVRQDMVQGLASVRQDMASQRADLIKWAFLFWLGQVGATAAMLALMLRGLR